MPAEGGRRVVAKTDATNGAATVQDATPTGVERSERPGRTPGHATGVSPKDAGREETGSAANARSEGAARVGGNETTDEVRPSKDRHGT